MLTIALPKGRLLEESSILLQKAGLLEKEIKESRKLFIEQSGLGIILAKPQDVPTYVKCGVTDLGIAGKDVLMESNELVYELLDLNLGLCRLSLCGPAARNKSPGEMLRIATKYPETTEKYFLKKGQQVEIIMLNGSIELAPILGLSDYIVDIVSTGKTLKENGLQEKEIIVSNISARLIANQGSYNIKTKQIDDFVYKLEAALE